MRTFFFEASQNVEGGVANWGKFAVCRWDGEEWLRPSALPAAGGAGLVAGRGWTAQHLWVLDLQTGEGACFRPGGYVKADLEKHAIWVCPMFEPFLEWLYRQDLSDLATLPRMVALPEAPFEMVGYRRPGLDRARGDLLAERALGDWDDGAIAEVDFGG